MIKSTQVQENEVHSKLELLQKVLDGMDRDIRNNSHTWSYSQIVDYTERRARIKREIAEMRSIK